MNILRSHLYSGLVVVGFANGASDRIADSIARDGTATALLNMFGVRWWSGPQVLLFSGCSRAGNRSPSREWTLSWPQWPRWLFCYPFRN